MKTILLALCILFINLHLHSQSTSHPSLQPVYQDYSEHNNSTGAVSEKTRITGYNYGDKFIPNKKKDLAPILKLEPEAYSLFKKSRVCDALGLPLVGVGMVTAIFGWRHALLNDKSPIVPVVAGATIGLTGLVMNTYAGTLGNKALAAFNSHASSVSGSIGGKNFRMMFGINYNPVMRKTYPAFILKF